MGVRVTSWAIAGLFFIGLGCPRNTYIPEVRDNYATLIVHHGIYVHVKNPRIRAFSMEPPFACDERTMQLALRGVPRPEGLEEIERISGFDRVYSPETYLLITVDGPKHDPSGEVVVLPGTESEHPSISAANLANRYNDVAACLERSGS